MQHICSSLSGCYAVSNQLGVNIDLNSGGSVGAGMVGQGRLPDVYDKIDHGRVVRSRDPFRI